MRKEIDHTGSATEYRWFDVILEKEIAGAIKFKGDYEVRQNYGQSPRDVIGKATNLRVVGTELLADIAAPFDLQGLYPGLCYKINKEQGEKVDGTLKRTLVEGTLLYIGASTSLNIDETLEPFI